MLGLGTYAYAWAIGVPGYPVAEPMDALTFLRRAASLGLHLVQIGDNLPLDQLSPAAFGRLLEEATRLQIRIEVGTRGIAPDHLRRYLNIAKRCGSPLLRVVVDTSDHHPNTVEIVETLRVLLPELEQAGVTLAIENHDRFQAATLVRILHELASNYVGICLDTVNSFGSLEGPDVVIETLGPYVTNLHIKDFVIARAAHNMGFQLYGTPAGRGMLNIPRLLDRLAHCDRKFNAILELWPSPEPTMAATLAKEDAWVQESIDALRRLIPT